MKLSLTRYQYKNYTILIFPTESHWFTYRCQENGEERVLDTQAAYPTPVVALESAQKRIDIRLRRIRAEELLDNEMGDRVEGRQQEVYLEILEILKQSDCGD